MSSSIFSRIGAILAAGLLAAGPAGAADTVLASKHDLSIAGGGAIKATREAEVCLFCHTPHRGTGDTPLWNHTMSQASYTPYSSTTIRSEIGQPTGASKLCLSCHDGTVALGMVHSRSNPIEMQSGVTTMPAGRSNLGTDLSDDHPVSFKYDSALAATRGDLKDPSTLINEVKLDHNSDMQCTSCHDPHSNQYGKFLVRDNTASGLCVQCHAPPGWQDSVHRMSNKNWNGSGVDPWPFSEELTVSANACASCHVSHGAGTPQRLLTHADEERNCFSCHNGNVATKNVETDFNKFSVHPIFDNTGIHQPLEDVVNPPRHVECADCHDPHASQTQAATAPNASGALTGVRGVNSAGAIANAVQYEYELCYRCHADSANKGPARVNRQFPQTNTRIEFDSSNQSYHPIEVPSRNGTSVSALDGVQPDVLHGLPQQRPGAGRGRVRGERSAWLHVPTDPGAAVDHHRPGDRELGHLCAVLQVPQPLQHPGRPEFSVSQEAHCRHPHRLHHLPRSPWRSERQASHQLQSGLRYPRGGPGRVPEHRLAERELHVELPRRRAYQRVV
jgi:predicted CXXCH cytochrome family protein